MEPSHSSCVFCEGPRPDLFDAFIDQRTKAEARVRAILNVLHGSDRDALNWVVEQLLKELGYA